MRNVVVAVVAFVALFNSTNQAHAQLPLCQEATKNVDAAYAAGSISNPMTHDGIGKLRDACPAGTVVMFSTAAWQAVGKVCDFSKAIVNGPNGDVMCVVRKKGSPN